jgi:acetyl-CoA synthetase
MSNFARDVVMTLVGNRSEWVLAMVACFRLGAVVLPCSEQLRAKDLRLRLDVADPRVVVVDERNLSELEAAAPDRPTIVVPDPALLAGPKVTEYAELADDDPCLLTFTSGTEGQPKAVLHAQRYLAGQRLQAGEWLDAQPGELVWCTAASGWSKSARNAFIAPWLRGAAGLLHDGRFDPAERLELIAREGVSVLCMAPTEYRVIAKRAEIRPLPSLRGLLAAGEALNPEVLAVWHEATRMEIRDGFGQTETGQLTATPAGEPARPGSMGRPLSGVKLWIEGGELVVDPRTVPTFFKGYLGRQPEPIDRPWRTGDRVREEDGWFYFEARADDMIVSSGYRIGPFEVESALLAHDAVAEVAVVARPDSLRGEIVRAVVVVRDGFAPGASLATELQEHVKATTAPYKYPRQVDFVDSLPKTTSGKVRRAELRAGVG